MTPNGRTDSDKERSDSAPDDAAEVTDKPADVAGLELALDRSIAEADRGELIDVDEVLEELRGPMGDPRTG